MSVLPDPSSRLRATLIGGIAILLWSPLPLLTTGAREIPRIQLLAMSSSLAFVLSCGVLALRGRAGRPRCPWHTVANTLRSIDKKKRPTP